MIFLRSPIEAGKPFDLELAPGSVCKIIADSHEEHDQLMAAIAGLRKPLTGSVRIADTDIYSERRSGLAAIARCGIVWPDGGLVSNLSAWENMTLHAWYHMGVIPAGAEPVARQMLGRLGIKDERFAEYFNVQPVALDAFERVCVAMVRAQLAGAGLLVYGDFSETLDLDESYAVITEALRMHSEKEGGATLFLSMDEDYLSGIKEDVLIRI